ncbi:TonB-linked SusC/RagA family outer membrane protein [Catalinimonas alkaloidigena]|uniref:SusC/RagA family TonB-linked outer membrane protein n=1 Tax=Catalinimonas alkaloidigena TaxID=1075417 RepID=UPI002407549B|nr:SusC/RagA family TonB-linked outer membrane protein [Catalinimonas alkaloidigena]MDF9801165.1 TonB-linked SusC/RagA family outer membrane protein [Catalinimonas alkaloidigena]
MNKILYMCTLLAFLSFTGNIGMAQSRTVSGNVTSLENGESLPGVNILVQGSTTGTVTDVDGNYRISVPSDDAILLFSFIGYQSEEVAVNGRSNIDVALSPSLEQLSEVVVTSFGIEQEKQALGYSVQELQSREITETKQPNLVNALQGRVAGVQITNSGGAPGMSSRIIIRGLTSLNPDADNQPLFVVDGVPIDNTTVESDGTPRGMSNRVADLNTNDIESVNVLKGAAATALYGVRAANGAVIITTKKGQAGATKVNVTSSIGFEEINKYPDFQEKYGQGFSGAYEPSSFWPSWGAPVEAAQVIDPDHRYYDNTRNTMETGMQLENTVSVSGGNESATFYGSVSNLQQDGVIPFSEWDRTSAKLSGKISAGEKFDLNGSINYINSGGNRVPHDRIMERLMYWANTQDVTDYINPDGTQNTYGNTNPLYDARFATYEDDVNRIIGNLNFNYRPADWMSISYRIGTDVYSDSRVEILPGPLGIDGEVALSSTGFITKEKINSRDINSTLNISLNHTFAEKLDATLRIGNDVFDRSRNDLTSTGTDFVIPRFFNLSNTTELQTGEFTSQRRLIGVYGDLLLNYDDYLYLNITARNDWSSTLPVENRSFFYPSFNLGFVFNDVLGVPEFLSYGKFRASYAEVGKDADPYSTAITYTSPNFFPVEGQVGFTRSSTFGLPTLKPERTTAVEIGTDLRFFENRLSLDFTWYKSNSKDQIIPVPVSNATGFTRFVTNAGELENQGVEIILGATPVSINDFSWDVLLNFTRNRNRVVEIREGIENIVLGSQFGYAGSSVTLQLIEGDAYGNLYGRSYERYYEGGEPENLTEVDRDLPLLIGDDGFPVVNTNQLILGNAQPKWYGGIRNTFNYKGLSLSFLIDARAGQYQYDQYANFYSAFGKLDYSLNRNDVVVFDGLLADGSPNTQEVWLGQGIGPDGRDYGASFYRNIYRGVSENFVKDASFVKLRNISLGYTLPSGILDATPFSAANVSLAANNIILWTPWTGFDPESFSAGAGGNASAFTGLGYPGVQSYFFTLNLTL